MEVFTCIVRNTITCQAMFKRVSQAQSENYWCSYAENNTYFYIMMAIFITEFLP
jgi:hypothetical protein